MRFLRVLAVLALAARPGLPQGHSEPRLRPADPAELIVEVVDAAGSPVEVRPEQVAVTVGGVRAPVEALEPLGDDWRVVLYFDQLLTDPLVQRTAAADLAALAESLTAAGTVEIVLADQEIRTALPATRSARAVSEALAWIGVREVPADLQFEVRQRFVEEQAALLAGDVADSERGERMAELSAALRQALADETAALAQQRRHLLDWLLRAGGAGPRLLVMVSGGFDAEPARFYRQLLAAAGLEEWVPSPQPAAVAPGWPEVGRSLAVYDWLVVPYAPAATIDPMLVESEEEATRRREEKQIQSVVQDGREVDRVIIPAPDPRRLFRRREASGPAAVRAELFEAGTPLAELADATGGRVAATAVELGALVAALPERRLLILDPPPLGERPAEVETAWGEGGAPAGARIRGRRWVGRVTPEAVAAARAGRLLGVGGESGELPTAAVLPASEGGVDRLVVRYEGAQTATGAPISAVRVTVAVEGEDGEIETRHFLAGPTFEHAIERDPDGGLRVILPLELPAEGEPLVGAVVEELSTGRWGGAFADEGVVELGDDSGSYLLPAPKVVHLLAPREAMAMGPTRFDTVVSQARVARVDFQLDGRRMASSQAPPFAATLDLGKLPEMHEVEAIAFDGEGAELGRDRLTVNEGSGSFRVRIVDPRTPAQRRGREILSGPTDFGVEVKTPRGAELERIDFYWGDKRIGTRYAPPYLHRFNVPQDEPQGFLRVVGLLADGTSVEDVLFVNSPGSSERLDVDLVQLYVVVTDRSGKPLRGLERDRFKVREDGLEQELANFGDAGDQPLTVGLAIDSSASMFVKLPDVQSAAAGYLRGLSGRRDRAFVVGFGGEPRLARDTSSDLNEVIRGLYRLEPDGQTAIWRAVVYSLVQLQGVPGKKALIVYSDGADEDPEFSFRTCQRFAQRVGVPVYFIVSNDEIYRTGGKSLNVKGFLGRLENLAHSVGGRVFLTRIGHDLTEIYRQIDEELRSQYLIGYYPADPSGERWREIDVEVGVPGARARTIAGYFR